MIHFKANTRRAAALSDDLITTTSVGIEIRFLCSDAWEGLNRIAIFRGSGASVDVLLSGDSCTVPPEVLTKAGGELFIGLYGTDGSGSLVIPTVWADAGRILPGAVPSGVEPTPETQPLIDQLLAAAQQAQQIAQSVRDDADAGAFDGAPGAPGAPGPAGPGVPAGGTLGQVLTKGFGGDYVTVWDDIPKQAKIFEFTVSGSTVTGPTWSEVDDLTLDYDILAVAKVDFDGQFVFLPCTFYEPPAAGRTLKIQFAGTVGDDIAYIQITNGATGNTWLFYQSACVSVNQGSANAGKVLTVGSDGAVAPQEVAGGQHIWWTDELTVSSPSAKSASVAYSLLHGPVAASSSTVSAGDYVIGPPFPENPQYGEEITGDPLWLYTVTNAGSGSSCALKARVLIPEAVDLSAYRTADDQDAIDYQLGQAILGKLDVRQGTAHAGEFLVVGSDGNITTVTMSAWNGGAY